MQIVFANTLTSSQEEGSPEALVERVHAGQLLVLPSRSQGPPSPAQPPVTQ